MDAEILARVQFALTVMFHYIYPPLSIGIGLQLVFMEGAFMVTKRPVFHEMARFWTRIFALTFSIGVATGIVMEFEFGTNWATYSRYVGDVFGSALAAEGVFAFFLESGFLALLLFGWNRFGPKLHFFSTVMVSLGAHFSAIWIVVANSWMQTPAGFQIEGEGMGARAVITDFWAMVFNPSSVDRLLHTILGAWLAGAFLVASVAAYYLLTRRHENFAKASLKIALSVAFVVCLLQAWSGHRSAEVVVHHQPAKLAAMEGVFTTQPSTPMILFGVPNTEAGTVDHAVELPGLLSFLSHGDFTTPVEGLDRIDRADWPNVGLVFQTYRIMIACWLIMMALSTWGMWSWYRGRLSVSKWLLRLLVPAALLPQVANQLGWVTAEVGRYPWMVQGLLRISEGLSKSVAAGQIVGSIIMFGIVYVLLFALFVFLLDHKIRKGPVETDREGPYHHLRDVAKGLES